MSRPILHRSHYVRIRSPTHIRAHNIHKRALTYVRGAVFRSISHRFLIIFSFSLSFPLFQSASPQPLLSGLVVDLSLFFASSLSFFFLSLFLSSSASLYMLPPPVDRMPLPCQSTTSHHRRSFPRSLSRPPAIEEAVYLPHIFACITRHVLRPDSRQVDENRAIVADTAVSIDRSWT